MQPAKASVVIVTYNSKDHIEECINSLLNQSFTDFEIVVVDNNSSDGSADYLMEHYKNLKVIKNDSNRGFGYACNIALKQTSAEYIAFLNPDVVVQKKWLEELIKTAETDKMIGACGSKVLYKNSQGNVLEVAYLAMDIYGTVIKIGNGEMDRGQYDKCREAFAVYGAALLVRRDAFIEAGLFDEKFFLQVEESDLCWRLHMLNYKVVYVPSSIAYHVGSASISQTFDNHNWFISYLYSRNKLRSMLKNMETRNLFKRFSITVISSVIGYLILAIIHQNVQYIAGFTRAIFWNIKEVQDTLHKRAEIQRKRIRDDAELEVFLHKEPFFVQMGLVQFMQSRKNKLDR